MTVPGVVRCQLVAMLIMYLINNSKWATHGAIYVYRSTPPAPVPQELFDNGTGVYALSSAHHTV